jgi:hypothetical protein
MDAILMGLAALVPDAAAVPRVQEDGGGVTGCSLAAQPAGRMLVPAMERPRPTREQVEFEVAIVEERSGRRRYGGSEARNTNCYHMRQRFPYQERE